MEKEMTLKFFDIVNGQVVINHNCLSIPELKAVHDAYENPIPAFNFLFYKFDPESAYANIEEDAKEDIILGDFPGEYTLEDEVIIAAMTKLDSLTVTPTYRYYLDNKRLMERLGSFVRTAEVTTGRDGNIGALQSQVKSVGKTIMEFKQLEKVALQELEELKGRTRGNKKLAYDQ
jgi:hypothetical protein